MDMSRKLPAVRIGRISFPRGQPLAAPMRAAIESAVVNAVRTTLARKPPPGSPASFKDGGRK